MTHIQYNYSEKKLCFFIKSYRYLLNEQLRNANNDNSQY